MKRLLGRWLLLVTVRGRSMEPALRDGEVVLARRRRGRSGARPQVGQVVVLPIQLPDGARLVGPVAEGDGLWVKRVAALPGHPIPAGVPGHPGPVPPGRIAVLGDNAAVSTDSRAVGLVPLDAVVAVVFGRKAGPAAPRGGGTGRTEGQTQQE
ncbi:S26 family signal peptidase [Kitasatospora misakiensis]|uniref:S26 family signal peptidase n=1 Tax=Kitasatospora misakiensis TaxID=67330 RepID=A0ABW0WTX6_9ACTN